MKNKLLILLGLFAFVLMMWNVEAQVITKAPSQQSLTYVGNPGAGSFSNPQFFNDSNFSTFISPNINLTWPTIIGEPKFSGITFESLPQNASQISYIINLHNNIAASGTMQIRGNVCVYNYTSSSYLNHGTSSIGFPQTIGDNNVSLGGIKAYRDFYSGNLRLATYGGAYTGVAGCGNGIWDTLSSSNANITFYENWIEYVIDNTPPVINSISISDGQTINSTVPSRSYGIQVNNTEDSFLESCWYSLNGGANTTYSCTSGALSTATVTNIPTGTNSIRFYAMNDVGAIVSATRTFNFFMSGMYENSQTFNNVTIEGATENFRINISYDSSYYPIAQAQLEYNGTLYDASALSSGANNIIFTRTITIPEVDADSNMTFKWIILLYNGTTSLTFNSTSQVQTVLNLEVDDCSVFSTVLLNMTVKDEDDFTILPNATIESEIKLFSSDRTIELFEGLFTSANSTIICISQNLTASTNFYLDAIIKYYDEDYVTEYHYIDYKNMSSSIIPITLDLLLLSSLRSQEFLITYKDKNFIPVEGAIIEITRQYLSLGEYLTVEAPKTDRDGRTISHLVLGDEVYTLYVRKNGILLAAFEDVRAFCANILIGDCRININELSTTTKFGKYETAEGISFTQSYNETTKNYIVSFIVDDSSIKNVNLTITKFDTALNNTICSTSIDGSLGTLNCLIPEAYYDTTAIAKIFVNDIEISVNIFSTGDVSTYEQDLPKYILAFFLIITIPLLGIASGPMTLVFFIVGLITAGALLLVDIGGFVGPSSAVMWLIIATFILIWKATRGSS